MSRNETLIAKCIKEGGRLIGPGCNTPNYVPDVFLFSVMLFLATYTISLILKDFKTASFFPSSVRALISDFSVVIAIFSMTFVDFIVGLDTPKLIVPQEFKVSVINPMLKVHMYWMIFCINSQHHRIEIGCFPFWRIIRGGCQLLPWYQLCFVRFSFLWISRLQLWSSIARRISSRQANTKIMRFGALLSNLTSA